MPRNYDLIKYLASILLCYLDSEYVEAVRNEKIIDLID